MEVTGKITKIEGKTAKDFGLDATIELPPVDVSKIKEGDKVWVETSVRTVKEGSNFIELNCCNDLVDIASIIAHFPQPKQEKDNQKAKVPKKLKEEYFPVVLDSLVNKVNEIIEYLEKKE